MNPHRAVTLYVAVAANRAGAGTGFADAAAHQEEIHDLAYVSDAVLVLGETHGPAHDRLSAAKDDLDGSIELLPRYATTSGQRIEVLLS